MFWPFCKSSEPVITPLFPGPQKRKVWKDIEELSHYGVGVSKAPKLLCVAAANEVLRHARIGKITMKQGA